MSQLVVVGFGLIGGSFALAQRQADPSIEITAIDQAHVLETELAQRTTQHQVRASDQAEVERRLRCADLVFVATPVHQAVAQIATILELAALVTDAASTKRAIAHAAAQSSHAARFVPGHPMAGAAPGGNAQARADLFAGRRWILCPETCTGAARAAVETWIQRTGAELCSMSVEEHDRAVAITSHLPQLLATTLLHVAKLRGAEKAAGPVFAEMTRTAGGPLGIWRDILESNADHVASALRDIQEQLAMCSRALEASPPDLNEIATLLERYARRNAGR